MLQWYLSNVLFRILTLFVTLWLYTTAKYVKSVCSDIIPVVVRTVLLPQIALTGIYAVVIVSLVS